MATLLEPWYACFDLPSLQAPHLLSALTLVLVSCCRLVHSSRHYRTDKRDCRKVETRDNGLRRGKRYRLCTRSHTLFSLLTYIFLHFSFFLTFVCSAISFCPFFLLPPSLLPSLSLPPFLLFSSHPPPCLSFSLPPSSLSAIYLFFDFTPLLSLSLCLPSTMTLGLEASV